MSKSQRERIAERFNQRQREAIDKREQRELERNLDYQPAVEGHLPDIA